MYFSIFTCFILASSVASWQFDHHHHYDEDHFSHMKPKWGTAPLSEGSHFKHSKTRLGTGPLSGGTQCPSTAHPPYPTAQPPYPTTLVSKPSSPAVTPTPTGNKPPNTPSEQGGDQQAALDAHNEARADVGSPALTWDDSLAADAKEWASHLVSVGSLTHSGTDNEGENLYMQSNSKNPFLNAANAFIAEKGDYNGGVLTDNNYSHYTQVVWKSTTRVGMASASGQNGEIYVVVRYSPPGNMVGEKPY